MGNVLVISFNRFPDGDAGSIRSFAFGKLLKNMGNDVTFIGMGDTPCFKIESYRGFSYTSLRIKDSHISFRNRLKNYFGFKDRLRDFILQYNLQKRIDTILMVQLPLNATIFIKRFSNKNNINLIFDCVEWYSPEQFRLNRINPEYILNNVNNRFIIDKQFKVIAISKFLEKYFKSRRIKTVRIPAILDVANVSYQKVTKKDILTIMYAGSPGKKDYLKEIIEGMALLNHDELQKVKFILIGITKDQLIKEAGIIEKTIMKVNDNISILGRVPRETVLKYLKYADFTVLLRSPIQRYAKAGFPTKLVESLASATPVITNITSDLSDYIEDMEQGLVIDNCSSIAFCHSLRRAIGLTYNQRCAMYIKARECAETFFDYSKYETVLDEII